MFLYLSTATFIMQLACGVAKTGRILTTQNNFVVLRKWHTKGSTSSIIYRNFHMVVINYYNSWSDSTDYIQYLLSVFYLLLLSALGIAPVSEI